MVLRLADDSGNLPDPFMGPVTIEAVRPFKQGWLVVLAGITTRTEAERITGRYLLRPFEEAPALDPGEVFYHQLLGMAVVTEAGDPVGTVVEVYDIDPADMLEVEAEDGRLHLVPFTQQVVRGVETDENRLVVRLPEGLMDL